VDVTGNMLTSLGYDVVTRTRPTEACETALQADPAFDLVITDYAMPRMTGAELAARLLEHNSRLPVLLCTGFSARVTPESALGMGFRALLRKPVSKRELAECVRRVLDEGVEP